MRATKGACNRGNLQVAITLPWGTFGCGCMFVLLEGIFYRFCKVVCNVVTLSVRALTYRIGFSHPPPPPAVLPPPLFFTAFLTGFGYSWQVRRTVVTRVHEAVKALALCHNVTPVSEDINGDQPTRLRIDSVTSDESDAEVREGREDKVVTYQASSPDEVRRRGNG